MNLDTQEDLMVARQFEEMQAELEGEKRMRRLAELRVAQLNDRITELTESLRRSSNETKL